MMTDQEQSPESLQPDHDSLKTISIHIFYAPGSGYLAECQHCDWSYAYSDRALLEAEGYLHLRSHPDFVVIDEDEEQALKDIEKYIQDFAAEKTERCSPTDHEWFDNYCTKCGYTLPTLKDQEKQQDTDEAL